MRNLVLSGVVLTLAPAAAAQDSVSAMQGLPGDGVGPYDTAEQLNTYVVDLQAFTTDWGTQFGIAPIIKNSRIDLNFFGSFFGPQAASADLLQGVPTPFSTYGLWNGQGIGVNNDPNLNAVPGTVNGPNSTSQFAVMFRENSGDTANVVSGIVNYDPTNPSRLYVARVPAVVNSTGPAASNASFGLGSIDANGNALVRADDFGLTGANQVSGSNIFRVDVLSRNTALVNDVGGNGLVPNALVFGDTGVGLIEDSGTTHNTPSQIPESIAGRSVYTGSNFASQYVYENVAGSTTTTGAHLGASSDHRGNVHFSETVVFPGSIGTCTLLGKDGLNNTTVLVLWGVDANGNVTGGQALLSQPATVTDNCDASTYPAAGTLGEFLHHNSQVAFQGGNGQVSIGRDGNGNILVATPTQKAPAMPDNANPEGAMLVARFDPSNIAGTTEWTVAAYTEGMAGKAILDGPGGTAIGQCVHLEQVTGGAGAGNPVGPSMSAPFIDGGGNVWFIGAIETFGTPSDFDLALMRAVYDADDFCYELEKVVEVGDVFTGQNSGTNYRINFLELADSNSIASEAFWSGNGIQGGWEGQNVGGLPAQDPRTLQGLVLIAEIVYDVNNDGMFVKVTGTNGDPNSLDQEYNVMLYVGNIDETSPPTGPVPYCTAKTSSAGCISAVSTNMPNNQPVSGAADYSITCSMVQGGKPGLMFAGTNGPANIVFSGGILCVAPPLQRGPIMLSGGSGPNTCDGSFATNVNDGSINNVDNGAGTSNWFQYWNRDPNNGPGTLGTQLSDAIQVDYQ